MMPNNEPQYIVELAGCQSVLLDEIARKETTQRMIAQTYHLALRSSERTLVDWGQVNRAIIDRWSVSGLNRIKELAWSGKCFEEKKHKCKPPSQEQPA